MRQNIVQCGRLRNSPIQAAQIIALQELFDAVMKGFTFDEDTNNVFAHLWRLWAGHYWNIRSIANIFVCTPSLVRRLEFSRTVPSYQGSLCQLHLFTYLHHHAEAHSTLSPAYLRDDPAVKRNAQGCQDPSIRIHHLWEATDLPLRMIWSSSDSTSNVDTLERSSGIWCRLFQDPHANWKKSSQGSALWSIPFSNEDAGTSKTSNKVWEKKCLGFRRNYTWGPSFILEHCNQFAWVENKRPYRLHSDGKVYT